MRFVHAVVVVLAVTSASSLAASRAFAQEGETTPPPVPPKPPPPPRPAPPSVSPERDRGDTGERGEREREGRREDREERLREKEAPEEADHDRYVGHVAFGYFGVSQLPIAQPASPGSVPGVTNVNAPVIGVRYWFSRRFGIDGGIGFGINTGSTATVINGGASTSVSQPSSFGFAAHMGVPIALLRASHYVFEIVPETLIGVTSGSISTPMQADQALTGLRFDLGARIGAEIHFGFIGIPQLALEGSVGLYYRHQAYKWSQANSSSSVDTNTFTTSVQSDPWAIFVNNVSALYYF
jgi:hypothetical protein